MVTISRTRPMDINQRIAELKPRETKRFLCDILQQHNIHSIRVSWLGHREISIKSYSGEVEICTLIKLFLLNCGGDRTIKSSITQLCKACDEELQKTLIYRSIMESTESIFAQLSKVYDYRVSI